MNSDLERLLKIYWEMTHIQYNQSLDPLGKEFKKLKAKLEHDLEKWDKFSKQIIITVKNDETTIEPIINKELEQEIESLKDTIEDFHRESKHSAEALSTLKQELQVKVLEIALLKEELQWTKKEWNNSKPSIECRVKLEKIDNLHNLNSLDYKEKCIEIIEDKDCSCTKDDFISINCPTHGDKK